jgi:hypothetical protein
MASLPHSCRPSADLDHAPHEMPPPGPTAGERRRARRRESRHVVLRSSPPRRSTGVGDRRFSAACSWAVAAPAANATAPPPLRRAPAEEILAQQPSAAAPAGSGHQVGRPVRRRPVDRRFRPAPAAKVACHDPAMVPTRCPTSAWRRLATGGRDPPARHGRAAAPRSPTPLSPGTCLASMRGLGFAPARRRSLRRSDVVVARLGRLAHG